MKKPKSPFKILLRCAAACVITAAVAFLFLYLSTPARKREDFKRISSQNYDSVLLSMFPASLYDPEDFAVYRGMTLLKTGYEIPDASTLDEYLSRIAKSGNSINTIYLGVLPEQITASELSAILEKYPSVIFEVIPAYPSLSYLSGLSSEEFSSLCASYEELIFPFLGSENIHFFSFFAQEWFISNPANYLTDFEVTEDISRLVMLNADRDHPYLLTQKNFSSLFEDYRALAQTAAESTETMPDLSQWTVIFFGDSIIANYTDSTSVPGVLSGISGASVHNLAVGGASASWDENESTSFPHVVQSFLDSGSPGAKEADRLCFAVNFGLNDYFIGLPADDDADPYNGKSYAGALRLGVKLLKEAFPDADIFIMSPNFTSYYGYGSIPQSENGGTLRDYVAAAKEAAADMNVHFLDNYTELGINRTNSTSYLLDGCHLNEAGRFLFGTHLAKAIAGL